MNGALFTDPIARARRHARPSPLRARLFPVTGLLLSVSLLHGCLPNSLDRQPPATFEPPHAAPEAAEVAPNPALVQQAQAQLAALGHRPGPQDGVLGPQTAAAIETYQTSKGLPADGRLSASLLTALEADLAKQAAPEALIPRAPKPRPKDARAAVKVPPVPRYLPGTRYLYANGEVQEVLASEGSEVRWRSNRGESNTRHRNFIVPPLSWSGGRRAGHRSLDVNADELWRQAAAGEAAFLATATTRDGGGPESLEARQENWSCQMAGEEEITVIAGTFVTRKLVCARLAADGTPELERSWFYAPSLRHFVLRQDRITNGQDGEAASLTVAAPLELVAIQPADQDWPPAARGGLARAMQHVLEELPAGETLDWSSSAVEAAITITAGEPLGAAGRSNCRRLAQTWTTEGETWLFPHLACRGPDGIWRFQGTEEQRLAFGLPS